EDVIEELRKAQAELENYSRNLEKMVEERTAQIHELNQKLKALLDSLNQGFLIFDEEGTIWEVTSKACESVLEIDPKGKKIWDVLKLSENKQEGFRKWLITLFGELLPFDDMAALGPRKFDHSQGRHVKLDYYPIRNEKNEISGVVLVSTDITELIIAQQEAEKEKSNSQFILKMFKQKKYFIRFLEEAKRHMNELKSALREAPSFWNLEEVFRILHTLKGGASSFSVKAVSEQAHRLEDLISQLRGNPKDFFRDNWDHEYAKLVTAFDEMSKEVQELLGNKNTESSLDSVEISRNQLTQIIDLLGSWSKTREFSKKLESQYLLESALETFQSFEHVTTKTADHLSKRLKPLVIETHQIHWFPKPYSAFFGSLVHVFRNAVDHGLESPEERIAKGKSADGEIRIVLSFSDNHYELVIEDDGCGINLFKLKKKLIEKGISVENLDPFLLQQKIFDPHLSTRDQISELSGRGVGLDAVKAEVERLGGTALVKSYDGKGTQFYFRWPAVLHNREVPSRKAS
ncbi:MAG: ATP-binding protein, partial [Bdellovibrionales bacterium]